MSTAPVSAVALGDTGNTYRPELPPGVIDHVDLGYEPRVRPMDALRAEGYPHDPVIVDNPYQVGLFLGAPKLRGNTRTLFPPMHRPGGPCCCLWGAGLVHGFCQSLSVFLGGS